MYEYSEKPNRIRATNPVFNGVFNDADCVECYRYNDTYDGDKYNGHALDGELEWEELFEREDAVVVDWKLMDKEDYESTVLEGSPDTFEDFFDSDDLVLVVLYAEVDADDEDEDDEEDDDGSWLDDDDDDDDDWADDEDDDDLDEDEREERKAEIRLLRDVLGKERKTK